MEVRPEQPEDITTIHQVNLAAFGREAEANLVAQLRGIASTFSFVAVEREQIIGHVFFSPVEIEGKDSHNFGVLGLAPVAVLPSYQYQGIGTLLIHYGLQECTRLGYKAVVVLGHPEYYSRFGFISAQPKGLACEYDVPEDAFMVLELAPNALKGCVGTVKYRPEFNQLA